MIIEYLDRIISLYQSAGYSLVPYRLDFQGTSHDMLGDIDTSYDHMLLAGGDGTVNYVVNRMKEHGLEIPMAILPTGTANDFGTMLGMSPDILKTCEDILGGRRHKVDLGKVNGTYFVNVFSCGLFTDISQKTPTLLKNNFGKIAYYVNGIGELPRFRKMKLDIKTDGGDFKGKVLIFFVFNGQTAGNLPIAYLSSPDDGLLDVLIVKADTPLVPLRPMLKYLTRIGKKVKEYPSDIVHIRCSQLQAVSERNESTDMDGQPGPSFPLEITCEKEAITVIIPAAHKI